MPRNTNWIILTGAPNSGKSSALDRLAFLGYHTVPENARLFIDEEVSKGKMIQEIRSDEQEFQNKVFSLNKEIAQRFPPEELIFFDRGLGDSVAYFDVHGMNAQPAVDAAKNIRYRQVFLFERLLRNRNEMGDERIADKIEQAIERAYTDLGYDIARIPAAPISERVEMILKKLG